METIKEECLPSYIVLKPRSMGKKNTNMGKNRIVIMGVSSKNTLSSISNWSDDIWSNQYFDL